MTGGWWMQTAKNVVVCDAPYGTRKIMVLLAKSKQDMQRMLLKSPKSKSMIYSPQSKLSSESISSDDDDGGSRQNKIIASDDDGVRKKKFWSVLSEAVAARTANDPYVPPFGMLPLQHAPVDQFAYRNRSVVREDHNVLITNTTNHTECNSHIIRAAKTRKHDAYQRLDRMDCLSSENIHHIQESCKTKQSSLSVAISNPLLALKSSSSSQDEKRKSFRFKRMMAHRAKMFLKKLSHNSKANCRNLDEESYKLPDFKLPQPKFKKSCDINNGILIDVIPYGSSGEDELDVRSETTSRVAQNSGSHASSFEFIGNIIRCHSFEAKKNDVSSESMQSKSYLVSSFPVTVVKSTSLTSVSESNADSNTANFSNPAKPATQLNMVISPDAFSLQPGTSEPKIVVNGLNPKTERSMTFNKNLLFQESMAPAPPTSPINTNIYKQTMMNRSSHTLNWKNLAALQDHCDGKSMIFNLRSRKSRRDYQEAIQSKNRLLPKKKVHFDRGQLSIATMANSKISNGAILLSSPEYTANLTGKNLVKVSKFPPNDFADTFCKAPDFSITQFPTNEYNEFDERLQIGVNITKYDKVAWNMHANSYQDLNTSMRNQSYNSQSVDKQHHLSFETLTKTTSFSDELIESLHRATLG